MTHWLRSVDQTHQSVTVTRYSTSQHLVIAEPSFVDRDRISKSSDDGKISGRVSGQPADGVPRRRSAEGQRTSSRRTMRSQGVRPTERCGHAALPRVAASSWKATTSKNRPDRNFAGENTGVEWHR